MIKKSKIKNQKSKTHIKIQNFAFYIVILIFAFCILNFNCFAEYISSAELIRDAKQYTGKRVIYHGEVVGDIMLRKEYAWLNLFDGNATIGIWVKKDILPQIKYVGGYLQKGDFLEIEGIFHASCPQHGGDLDIHAEKVRMIREGSRRVEKISPAKRIWARNFVISAFFLLICIIIRDLFQKRKR